MALVIKDIPLEKIVFVKYPAGSRASAPGRVFPIQAAADELFARIAADEPFATDQSQPSVGTVPAGPDAAPDPTASGSAPPPSGTGSGGVIVGATGQTAADRTCSKSNR